MTDLLLAEQVFLLDIAAPDTAYAAAVLLDLAEENLIRMDGARIGPINRHASHALLAQARTIITSSDRFRTADHWVHWLPAEMRKDDDGALAVRLERSLRRRGSLDDESAVDLRRALHAALADDADPPPRMRLLVALLHASRALGTLIADRSTSRAAEIASAVQEDSSVHAAVLAALTPVISTSSI